MNEMAGVFALPNLMTCAGRAGSMGNGGSVIDVRIL